MRVSDRSKTLNHFLQRKNSLYLSLLSIFKKESQKVKEIFLLLILLVYNYSFFSILLINSHDILLIDWNSSIEIGLNVKYNGALSTASNFILHELAKNTIQCFPTDDCISFMKMILLEIIPKKLKGSCVI